MNNNWIEKSNKILPRVLVVILFLTLYTSFDNNKIKHFVSSVYSAMELTETQSKRNDAFQGETPKNERIETEVFPGIKHKAICHVWEHIDRRISTHIISASLCV